MVRVCRGGVLLAMDFERLDVCGAGVRLQCRGFNRRVELVGGSTFRTLDQGWGLTMAFLTGGGSRFYIGRVMRCAVFSGRGLIYAR